MVVYVCLSSCCQMQHKIHWMQSLQGAVSDMPGGGLAAVCLADAATGTSADAARFEVFSTTIAATKQISLRTSKVFAENALWERIADMASDGVALITFLECLATEECGG